VIFIKKMEVNYIKFRILINIIIELIIYYFIGFEWKHNIVTMIIILTPFHLDKMAVMIIYICKLFILFGMFYHVFSNMYYIHVIYGFYLIILVFGLSLNLGILLGINMLLEKMKNNKKNNKKR